MTKEVTIVYGDDWEGLYVDGKLVAQNHSVSAISALESLGFSVNQKEVDYAWLLDEGNLPDSLSDVKMEKE